ncbi:MAG: 3-deoxy-8-phosphooctulonate synthase [bacterium]|nr:3-deoxy-8-phosphooctulonate synthase [bacterium]
MKVVEVNSIKISNDRRIVIIAGPCALESEELLYKIASHMKEVCIKLNLDYILKASYDKANRTSIKSFRGPGLKGLKIIEKVKLKVEVPVLVDVHLPQEVKYVKDIADILQIPAFLSRQTDLLIACGLTKKPVNIKKAQFMSPYAIKYAIEKILSTGNKKVLVTERGSCFGYNNLVVDMRAIEIMKDFKYPVIFDCSHSAQIPSNDHMTHGDARFIPVLAKAAVAVGVAGVYFETHPDPSKALSDKENTVKLSEIEKLLRKLKEIDEISKKN